MNKKLSNSRWQRLLNKVRNKRVWYTIVGLIVMVLFLYVVETTFVSVSIKQRAVIGIALQLFTGFIIGADQVIANLQFKESKDIWDLLARRRMRISLLICLIISLIAVLYWLAASKNTEITPLTVYATIAGLVFLYYPYMYWTHLMVKLLEKGRGLEDLSIKESSIVWSNAILLGISAIVVVLTGLLVTPQQGQWVSIIWCIIVAYFITPTVIFSLTFFLITGAMFLFTLLRKKVKRSVFWMVLLGLWTWGGLLLLVDVLAQ